MSEQGSWKAAAVVVLVTLALTGGFTALLVGLPALVETLDWSPPSRPPDPRRIKHVTCWSGGVVVFSVVTENVYATQSGGHRLTDVVTGRQYVVTGTCVIE